MSLVMVTSKSHVWAYGACAECINRTPMCGCDAAVQIVDVTDGYEPDADPGFIDFFTPGVSCPDGPTRRDVTVCDAPADHAAEDCVLAHPQVTVSEVIAELHATSPWDAPGARRFTLDGLTYGDLIALDSALNEARWSALDSRNAMEAKGRADLADGAQLRMTDADALLTRVRALLYG